MISKRKAIIGALLIFVLTTALNFTVGGMITSSLGFAIPRGEMSQYEKLLSLKDFLQKNYYKQLDEEELMEGAIKGMFDSIEDPYTQYMNDKEFGDLMTQTSGIYGGIGIVVTPGEDGYVTVVSPIEGTPGEKAGLLPGDKIISVDGQVISGDKLDSAVELMKGEVNTEVTLSILRQEKSEPFDVNIVREEIRLETVRSEVIENNIGYIKISNFDEKTAQDFETQLNNLESQGIDGLVLDLRNNPGGLLDQCVEIADMLLGEQTIVYTEDRNGNREIQKSDKKQFELPLSVLVNEGSASASEILSGAIKDGNRGKIIGTTTFGKGLVQQVRPLNDGTGFKFTISEYFTPNGINIHGTGIEPDIIVELQESDIDETTGQILNDTQLTKAINTIKGEINN